MKLTHEEKCEAWKETTTKYQGLLCRLCLPNFWQGPEYAIWILEMEELYGQD